MAKYMIYIVTYNRGVDWKTGEVRPFHWAIFIQTDATNGKNEGIAHQLCGMAGGYYYPGPETIDLNKSAKAKQEMEIGEIDDTKLTEIWACLKEVNEEKNESSPWNCQDWALEGVEKLRAKGFIGPDNTREVIKY